MNSPAGPLSPIAPLLQDPALQRHLVQCAKARGRWFGVALLVEWIHGVIAPRLATTAALGALTVGLVLHWL